jgi:branched-chain amino acid transport system ATP-binding protein
MSEPTRAPLLSVDKLDVHYGQFRATHCLDLEVGEGEVVSIIGANGAGKSSLMKAIVGQVGRKTGAITFAGRDITDAATRDIVKGGIALVPEGRRLFPSLTVRENLRIGWELGSRGPIDFDQIHAWFPILAERADSPASTLSGGQQQMVALGRALLTNPRLLLCDEISLGLSPLVVSQIYQIIPRILERGIAVVLVEQDIGRALSMANRFYCLLEGHVSLTGRPAEVDRETIMKHYFGV